MRGDDASWLLELGADEPHRPVRPGRRGVVRAAAALVGCGLLAAAATLPYLGSSAAVVRAAADSWAGLPAGLPAVALPQPSVLEAADGTPLARMWLQNRSVVPLSAVAPVLRAAVVAVEDSRFYAHDGVDVRALGRALTHDVAGSGGLQGGSTLTQQYVKQVLELAADTPAGREAAVQRSLARKLREARLALALEHRWSKDQILAAYLNIAYFGDGAYGVEAAARLYFSVPAAALTLPQAALLAGLVNNPSDLDPVHHPAAALARRRVVLRRMVATGVLGRAEAAAADTAPLGLRVTRPRNGCEPVAAPFFCDWVRHVLETDPAFGATAAQRQAHLLSGGLRIRTTLDLRAQAAAQAAVDLVPASSRVASVLVSVRPGTGEVVALAVSRRFGPRASTGQTELALASTPAFAAGSTFKAFTLAAALERGVSPGLVLAAPDRYVSPVLANPPGGFHNAADGEGGVMTLARATADSVNTFFVQLEERVSVPAVAEMAHRLGVGSLPLTGRGAPAPTEGALTLGDRGVSALELAGAYASFAAHGRSCVPTGIVSITDPDGRREPVPDRRCRQVLSPAVADGVTQLLTGVVSSGTAARNARIGRPAAGKTGTTSGFGTAWFVGYTPALVTASLLADPRGPAYPLVDVLGYRQVFGGDLPTVVWAAAMRGELAGTPVQQFAAPAPVLPAGPAGVPDVVGLPVSRAAGLLAAAGLVVRQVPAPPDAAFPYAPAGTVVATVPPAGTPARPGQPVTLTVSG